MLRIEASKQGLPPLAVKAKPWRVVVKLFSPRYAIPRETK